MITAKFDKFVDMVRTYKYMFTDITQEQAEEVVFAIMDKEKYSESV